jgi:hypothetical protein
MNPRLLFLVFVVACALFLRFEDFSGHWVWQDELTSLEQIYSNDYGTTADAPLFSNLLKIPVALTGWSNIDGIRFFSIILSLTVPLFGYFVCKRLTSVNSELFALILFGCMEFFIAHAINIRPYSLFMGISLITYYAFIEFTKDRISQRFLLAGLLFCALTHLLSVQLYISLFVSYALCLMLLKESKPFSLKKLFYLGLSFALTGALGSFWFYWRLEATDGSEIGSAVELHDFFIVVFRTLPMGTLGSTALLGIAWLFFLIGLVEFFKNRKELFILTLVTLTVTCVFNCLTLGDRAEWLGYIGSNRYFAHSIALSVLVVANGASVSLEFLLSFPNGRLKNIMRYTVLVLICLLLSGESYFSMRNVIRDSYLGLYQESMNSSAGILISSINGRYLKTHALLQAYNNDSRTLYSVHLDRIFIQTPVKPSDLRVKYLKFNEQQVRSGILTSNIPCKQVAGYFEKRTPTIKIHDLGATGAVFKTWPLYECCIEKAGDSSHCP